MKVIDLTGQTFGLLTVISRNYSKNRTAWDCKCECGSTKIVISKSLRSGQTKSCGCTLNKQRVEGRKTHGSSKSKEYESWLGIKKRCFNRNNNSYKNYGGRGITVCDRWVDSFENFLVDMGLKPSDNHSIERVNNNKDYEPDNCVWANKTSQARNTRRNRNITIGHSTRTLAEWAVIFNIGYSVFHRRLNKGYSEINALTKPIL